MKNDQKTVKVIKNALSRKEQRAIGDRWADHKGPRMTLAQVMARAASLEQQTEKQLTE